MISLHVVRLGMLTSSVHLRRVTYNIICFGGGLYNNNNNNKNTHTHTHTHTQHRLAAIKKMRNVVTVQWEFCLAREPQPLYVAVAIMLNYFKHIYACRSCVCVFFLFLLLHSVLGVYLLFLNDLNRIFGTFFMILFIFGQQAKTKARELYLPG